LVSAKAYKNIETETGWVSTHLNRKAQIWSAIYEAAVPGPVQFRIEGYRSNGSRFPDADDTITLYVDNSRPQVVIDENITMGSQTLGNCALFTLPPDVGGAPLRVTFKVDQKQGFVNSYALGAKKGATGNFAIQPTSPEPPYHARSYQHGDDLLCNQLRGTFDDPTSDPVTGFVSVEIGPASGAWLEPDQTFCAFSINLTCSTRTTNGYHGFGPYQATPVLIGIQK
jgi:hypothetical protein